MDPLTAVLEQVVSRLPAVDRPLVVAVDGADGAGKTMFADQLGDALSAVGRVVERSSIDDFLHPQEFRHALGRTPQTIWERSHDLARFRGGLVDPWCGGQPAGVLLVDGIFLQRPELRAVWDLVVWLDVPDAVRVARMAVRDGGVDDVADPDQQRYLGAQRIYRDTCDPAGSADVVIDNTDWSAPRLLRG